MIEIKIDDSYDELWPVSVDWSYSIVRAPILRKCVGEGGVIDEINNALEDIARTRREVKKSIGDDKPKSGEGALNPEELKDLIDGQTLNIDLKKGDK